MLIKTKSRPALEKNFSQQGLCFKGSTHLWSSRGLSSWDHSCRFRCLPGKLRVQSTGPCRRPWGSRILALPIPQSSGSLPGHTPLAPSTLGPGSPLKRVQRDNVKHNKHLLGPVSRDNLQFLFELGKRDKSGGQCTSLSACEVNVQIKFPRVMN